MSQRRAIVAGAGLAGLAAAVALRQAGLDVAISDSAAQAGGRCRSYHDPVLGMTIDNGNHLVLSGNAAVADFRAAVGADTPLAGPAHADFAFADLASGERWTLRMNDGDMPWWIASKDRRVPGTRLLDYLPLMRLLSGGNERIDSVVRAEGPLWERMLEPVLLAALNTDPAQSSARLAANVLKETIGQGGLFTRPRIAVPTLASAFVDPAAGWLAGWGTFLKTGRRLRHIEFAEDAVRALEWSDGREEIGTDDVVVLAVPSWIAAELAPGINVPTDHRGIVNVHFAVAPGEAVPDMPDLLGLLGGTAQWLFCHPGRVSVTISAADALIGLEREELAARCWRDVAQALNLSGPLPPWQVVKEKRATFAATPVQDALRPESRTPWRNLFLAGDWVQNGLPATIEGALRSGDNAARLALGQPLRYGMAA